MDDVALSKNGRRVLAAFFGLLVAFLYAPIVVLLIFSFNDSELPTFPLSGFTTRWYRQFLSNPELHDSLKTSMIVAALSSVGAVLLGVLASLALVRRRFFGKAAASAFLLSPLVIPYVVFGVSLLLFFHALSIDRSITTVVIGHIVITLPYTILVIVPRLSQIDVSLEEAAYDLGASRIRAFRSVILPLILPAIVAAFLIAFTTSFDEFAVASFVVGTDATFPIYLYRALRFPSQLPEVIAVAVVVMILSLLVVVLAEVGRRVAERRIEALDSCSLDLSVAEQQTCALRLPVKGDARAARNLRQHFVGEKIADHPTPPRFDVKLGVHPQVDDLDHDAVEVVTPFPVPPHRPARCGHARAGTATRSASPLRVPEPTGTTSRCLSSSFMTA